MKDLVAATGLPKSTIQHYLAAGLLPRPKKTSPNVAYYDPQCVDRLRLIKSLQSRHRLPLEKIRQMLHRQGQGEEVAPLIELSEAVFGPSPESYLDETGLAEASGLTRRQIKALRKAQLLLPLEPGRYDGEDLAMASLYARGLSEGLTIEDMSFYPRLGKLVVDAEMALRRRLTHHLPYDMDAAATLEMVKAARATRAYVIDRLFQKRIAAAKDLKDEGLLK